MRLLLSITFFLKFQLQISPGLQQFLSMRIREYDLSFNIKSNHGIGHAAQNTGQMPLLVIETADIFLQLFSHVIE
ncbi:hypothetical protein D3C85_1508890 [compost metagenome]